MFATDRVHLLRPNLQIPAKTLVVWSAIYPVIICLANLLDKQLHCFQFAPPLYVHSCYTVTVICREIPTGGKANFLASHLVFSLPIFCPFVFFEKRFFGNPLKNYDPIFHTPSQLLSLAVCCWVSVCFSL